MSGKLQPRWFDILLSPLVWVVTAIGTVLSGLYIFVVGVLFRVPADHVALSIIARAWGTFVLLFSGSRVRIFYEEEDLSPPRIFMGNHQSHTDIPVNFLTLPIGVRFVSKKEIFRVPVMGWCMRIVGYFSIDRQNQQAAIASMKEISERMREEKISIWVAPEGTRSETGELQAFKKGPFHLTLAAKLPVVPVWISGTQHLLPKRSWIFRQRFGVDVLVGRAITDHLTQTMSLEELSARVRTEMERLRVRLEELLPSAPPRPFVGVRYVHLARSAP